MDRLISQGPIPNAIMIFKAHVTDAGTEVQIDTEKCRGKKQKEAAP